MSIKIDLPGASFMQSGNILHDIEKVIVKNIEEKKRDIKVSDKMTIVKTNTSKFQDLFWFINNNFNIEDDYAGLCIMSLNMSFGNIRIDLFNSNPNDWKRGSALFKSSKSDMSAAIYPASMFHIKSLKNGETHTCIEQLVNPYKGESWQKELSTCSVAKMNDTYEISIEQTYKNNSPTLKYVFKDTEKEMFEQALNYCMTNGQQLSGLYQIMCR
jgi:hypothetical protein